MGNWWTRKQFFAFFLIFFPPFVFYALQKDLTDTKISQTESPETENSKKESLQNDPMIKAPSAELPKSEFTKKHPPEVSPESMTPGEELSKEFTERKPPTTKTEPIGRSDFSFLAGPAHWLEEFYDFLTNRIYRVFKNYINLIEVRKQNSQLKLELFKMSSQIQRLREVRNENNRLLKLFEFQKNLPQKTLVARVISKDLLLNKDSLVINKGSKHGVKRFQGVIAPKGVVGYALEVRAYSTRVLLLSNQEVHVDALIQRTRAWGLVSGLSPKFYKLDHLLREEDARPGDPVVTTGKHGYFPKGFPIGTIIDIKINPSGISYLAQIKPSVQTNRLENVLVILDEKELNL